MSHYPFTSYEGACLRCNIPQVSSAAIPQVTCCHFELPQACYDNSQGGQVQWGSLLLSDIWPWSLYCGLQGASAPHVYCVWMVPKVCLIYSLCSQLTSMPDVRHCESKWVIWVGQITQTQRLSKDYKNERVVVCLHGTRGEITYGEGDASTTKGWCRHRQGALLMSRSDRSWWEWMPGAFLKPRKS